VSRVGEPSACVVTSYLLDLYTIGFVIMLSELSTIVYVLVRMCVEYDSWRIFCIYTTYSCFVVLCVAQVVNVCLFSLKQDIRSKK